MDASFQRALSLVLADEGGWSNNPNDPGGATMQGITQRVYDAFRRADPGTARPASVRYISTADVTAIYRVQYWDAVRGDSVPAGLDYCLFDEAVNAGPVASIKDLQTALGVKADGQFGMVTMGALLAVNDRAGLIKRICALRLNWLHRLRTWRFFGKGWAARVARVQAAALKMVA